MAHTFRSVALVFALTVVCQGSAAQTIDDAWVMERVFAGKFDELRTLEAESKRGSSVAMYWWGALLEACVYGRCGEETANALWLKAGQAGNTRAKLATMRNVTSLAKLDQLIEKFGPPVGWEERWMYAGALAAFQLPGTESQYTRGEARKIVQEGIASEPRLALIFTLVALNGPREHADQWRALAAADHAAAMESFRRSLIVAGKGRYPQMLAMAKDGDLPVGAMLCETVAVSEGYHVLPADLLPICERALTKGYVGIIPALMRHHQESGNTKAAAFYADLCASVLIYCAVDLAEYHYKLSGKSAAWKLWDAVAGFSGKSPTEADLRLFGLSAEVMQQVFAVRLRGSIAERACDSQLYDRVTKKFADDPACPYLKPVAIPAEFLGGTK